MNRRHPLGASLTALLMATVSLALTGPAAGAQADEVEVTVEPGLAGVVPMSARLPVRVTVQSESSRTVELELTTSSGSQLYDVEMNAGAPTQTDAVVLRSFGGIKATVRAPDGDRLGSAEARPDPTNDSTNVVGVGASIATEKQPWVVPSIAGIDEATLIPIDSGLLDRPGALDAIGGLVLAPADVERLSDDQQRRISEWVARGGNLALDQARADPLPILGTVAEAGDRTAVGQGWVRFTEGAAAAGEWSNVVEPHSAPDGPPDGDQFIDDMGVGGTDGPYDEILGSIGFLQISYLPSSVIGLSVLLTALLVGPILWWALRSRLRRRLMWIAAPTLSLVVAGALLTVGRGALADASTSAQGAGVSTEWGTSGEFGLGTTPADSVLKLGDQGQVWASKPQAVMSGSGGELRAKQPLGTNDFGYAGIGRVTVDDGPAVSVRAVARPDGQVSVSVTNHAESTFTGVMVSGFSREQAFDAVAAGATATMRFEANQGLNPLGGVFPIGAVQDDCFEAICSGNGGNGAFGRVGLLPLAQRGRIQVSGILNGPLNVGGNTHPTSFYVAAHAPVVPPATGPTTDAGASLRVETVGTRLTDGNDVGTVEVGGGESGGEGLDVPVETGPDGHPVNIPPATQISGPGGPPDEPLPQADSQQTYVRVSSPINLRATVCAVHTAIDDAQVWTGTGWEPLATNGGRFTDGRFVEPNEAQRYTLPPMKAGDASFLRFNTMLAVNPAAAINCSEAS